MSPSPPLLGRVKGKLRQPKLQQAWAGNGVLSKGDSPGLSHLQALPLQACQGEEEPPTQCWVSAPPNRKMKSSSASTGEPLPWLPACPKGAHRKAGGYPGEQVWHQKHTEEQEAGHFGISKANT